MEGNMKNLAILGAFLAASGGVFAQSKDYKDSMHKIYADLEAAYNKRDADAIIAPLSPSYSWKMVDGKTLNLSDAKKEIKSELGMIQNGKWHVDIVSLIGGPSFVMVTVQYSFKGSMIDDSKRPYNVELSSTERQTWIKGSGGWQQTNDEILGVKSRADGQRVNPTIAVAQDTGGK
jgi:hypothetical protein